MKRKRNRLLAGLLALVMAVTATITVIPPQEVRAETEGDFLYTVTEDNSVSITRYIGSGGDVTIPGTIDGKRVTSIGGGAFARYSSLTGITIPNGVTSIEVGVFSGCSSLTSITIPDSVTSIGRSAFSGCSSLTGITIPNSVTSIGEGAFNGCSSLTSITIPDSVISIENSVFYSCSSLTSITIPDSVTSIGNVAFYNCSSLTGITIPNSVTSIGGSAFSFCSSLTSVTIPDSVTSIGNSAFGGCDNLTNITVDSGNGVYDSRENCNAIIERASNTLVQGCSTTTIPNTVTSIGESAFFYCSGLTDITIPNSVTSIGADAFFYCNSLTSITIPNSVTSIEYEVFYGCSSLTSITIPDSVTSIGFDAFCDCSSLADITIPNSVTSIGAEVFSGCSSLTGITIPDSVTSIGEYAFADCSSLTSITIPDSVTSIGDSVFYGCSSLTSITIPDSVTSIGYGVFSGCSSLTSITIPDSVTSIGEYVFADCSSLTRITVDEKNTVYDSRENCNAIIERASNTLVQGCSTTTIPNTVTSIGEGAFRYCSSLTSISIPDGVTSIEWGAFYGCSGLTSITIPDSVTSIGGEAFRYCSSLTSISIPDGVTSIGYGAFYGCSSLTSISIPDGVTSIEWGAFYGCSGLTSISIPDSVTSIGWNVFLFCDSLKDIYYAGTQEQWETLVTGVDTGISDTATVHYSSTMPEEPVPATTDIKNCTISLDKTTYTYDGKAKTPSVTVKDGDKVLVNKTDYTVKYTNNTDAGTAKVTVTGKGNYTGSKSETFTIDKAPLSGASITLKAKTFTYNGAAQEPLKSVTLGEKTLESGTDYTVNYTDNKNAGTATITVTGQGNYTGSKSENFTIDKASLSGASITLKAKTFIYNGAAQEPLKSVTVGEKTLNSKTDYTVSYSKNKNAGTATVTVKGKGNYTGSKSKNFTIDKAAQKITCTSSYTKTYGNAAFKVDAKRTIGDGKLTYSSSKTSVATVNGSGKVTIKGTGCTVITVKAAATTNYKAKSVKITVKVKPGKTTLSSAAPAGGKKLKVTWKKNARATGYQIQYCTSSSFPSSSAKTVTVTNYKTVSKTISGLVKGKRYYVRIRAYKTATVDGKSTKLYGAWSSAKRSSAIK